THVKGISSLAYGDTRRLLFTAQFDGFCKVYNAQASAFDRPRAVATLRGHQRSLSSVAMLDGTDTLITADRSGVVKLWDTRMWTEYQTLNSRTVSNLKSLFPFGPNRLVLVSDKRMHFMSLTEDPSDPVTNEMMVTASCHSEPSHIVVAIAINYLDREVLIAHPHNVCIYSLYDGSLVEKITFHH
ncbi:hypothetical protein Pmar_PMAR017199, partial [Perkinsus marinus ATCC 50983]